ncbi:MAG: phosphate signaling complex protein PhoU [Myxococcota bacterium]
MPTHTSQEFEAELTQLKDRLLAMGGRCERMIGLAMRAFEEQDAALAREVREMDRETDQDELAVDELAVRILALRQPVGRDLRFIITSVKAVTDLERIGDEAVNIAERADELADRATLPQPHVELPGMAESATKMLLDALDAFIEDDADKAQRVLQRDDEVDATYDRILHTCVDFIEANPDRCAGGLRVASAAKYLERIADHATNIAEMVVYLVRGVDVRHRGPH